jgi:hypothetical protein
VRSTTGPDELGAADENARRVGHVWNECPRECALQLLLRALDAAHDRIPERAAILKGKTKRLLASERREWSVQRRPALAADLSATKCNAMSASSLLHEDAPIFSFNGSLAEI